MRLASAPDVHGSRFVVGSFPIVLPTRGSARLPGVIRPRLLVSPTSPPPARTAAVRMLGGVRDAPAGRENDLAAIELARFAVSEHNSKTNAMLEFERLVKVRHQVVAGTMHHFTVEVKEAGGAKKLYEAKVWEKLWENFKQLQSFEPVGDAVAA